MSGSPASKVNTLNVGYFSPRMKSHLEKNMEHEMETVMTSSDLGAGTILVPLIGGYRGLGPEKKVWVCVR